MAKQKVTGFEILTLGLYGVIRPFLAIFMGAIGVLLKTAKELLKAAIEVMYFPLEAVLHLTPVDALIRRFSHEHDAIEHLEREGLAMAKKYRDKKWLDKNDIQHEYAEQKIPLLEGRLRDYAEMIAPSKLFPLYYVTPPKDLQFSIVQDGRLLNGKAPATYLAGGQLTEEFVKEAWSRSITVAIKAGWLTLLACVAASTFMIATAVNRGGHEGQLGNELQNSVSMDLSTEGLVASFGDVFTEADASALREKVLVEDKTPGLVSKIESFVQSAGTVVILGAVLLVLSLVIAACAGRLIWLGRFRNSIYLATFETVKYLNYAPGEAQKRWGERFAEREKVLEGTLKQINYANEVDKSPLIKIGVAEGTTEYVGQLIAPFKLTELVMSIMDGYENTCVFGSTGEGKSYNVYIPLVTQYLRYRKNGLPIGFYCTDDKCAIGTDIVRISRSEGLPDSDLIVIGTEPVEGLQPYRVDLMSDLTPVEFKNLIRSVGRQTGGGKSGDEFWPESASDLLLQCALLAQALEHTDTGRILMRQYQMRVYSIVFILKMACSDDLIKLGLKAIGCALQNTDDQYINIKRFDTSGLHAALDYLIDNFLGMADATKVGIIQNARMAIGLFTFSEQVAEGFATGISARIVTSNELRSNKIAILSLSQVQHGATAKFVNVALKTLYYKQCRLAEIRDPAFSKAREAWWRDPKPGSNPGAVGEEVSKYAMSVFLADEFPSLVTSSDDGTSDATFWNVNRSTCTAGIIFAQSTKDFELALGPVAATKMLANFKTKILLRCDDEDTVEQAITMVGRTLRIRTNDGVMRESQCAIKRETGISAENLPPIRWTPELREIERLPFLMSPGHFDRFHFSGYVNPEDMQDENGEVVEAEEDFEIHIKSRWATDYWTNDDLLIKPVSQSQELVEMDATHIAELRNMGKGRALCTIQRAGRPRTDYVKLFTPGEI